MNTYCLVRILGNDQPPRHSNMQTEKNVQFIIEHEPRFENCDKVFVLNRMWHPKKQIRIKKLIQQAGYQVLIIPFKRTEYIKCKTEKQQLLYLTNQNEARNFAIKSLVDKYDVVLPFDSGTCFRQDGWDAFVAGVEAQELQPYYIVPMWRLKEFGEYANGIVAIKEKYIVKLDNKIKQTMGLTEPQICVTRLYDRLFTEGMEYGKANKVDMLWMLGVPGPWQIWSKKLHAVAKTRMSKYAGTIKSYGFVCRLPSGARRGDENVGTRALLRNNAKKKILKDVNAFLRVPNKTTSSVAKSRKIKIFN